MANIKDILNYAKEAATVNGYSYRIVRSLSDVNAITANQFPLICLLPPPTEAAYLDKATHSFTVFVLDKVKKVKQDTTKNTNDRYHAEYKALDDAFYAWHTSMVNSNSGQSIFSPVGEDISISRLWDGRTNEELIGSQYEVDFITTWYCNGSNPDIPSGGGGSCDPATVLNADGSSYLTVASGGSVQLTGVTIAGQTPNTGVQNDGTTFTVSGVTVSGNTSATGVKQDGTTFSVSGVTIAGNTTATGVQQDGATFSVSGVSVTDAGSSTTYNDGSSVSIYRSTHSIEFDGVNEYATIPESFASGTIEYNTAWSLEFWWRSNYNGANIAPLFDWMSTRGVRVQYLGNSSTPVNNALQFNVRSNTNERLEFELSTALNDNVWRQLVWTYNGSGIGTIGNHAIYINGSAVSVNVSRNDIVSSTIYNNADVFLATNAALSRPCPMNMDGLKLFNVALSPAQVASQYNNGVPVDSSAFPNLVEQFTWNNTANGSLGNFNATLFNNPSYSKNRP